MEGETFLDQLFLSLETVPQDIRRDFELVSHCMVMFFRLFIFVLSIDVFVVMLILESLVSH